MKPFYEDLFNRFHELHTDIMLALDGLPAEALDWKPGPETNSVSVLVTHLTGAERFLIGDVVMGESSNRNRDAEFQVEGLSKGELIQRLTDTEAYLKAAFEKLGVDDLNTERKHPRHGKQVGVAWAILHALEHTATHLGHIQMTLQLWQQKTAG